MEVVGKYGVGAAVVGRNTPRLLPLVAGRVVGGKYGVAPKHPLSLLVRCATPRPAKNGTSIFLGGLAVRARRGGKTAGRRRHVGHRVPTGEKHPYPCRRRQTGWA